MSGKGRGARFLSVLAATAVFFLEVRAQNLTWHFEQLYSNADGNIQFVVLNEYADNDNQHSVAGSQLSASHLEGEHGHEPGYVTAFIFSKNLPSNSTAGRRFLVGTQAFADLGIITPDYVVTDQFLASQKGSLTFYRSCNTAPHDAIAYPSIPSDGINASYRDGSRRPNLAMNFAGETASVPATPVSSPTTLAIEYYHAAWDHYFMTSFPDEIALLDGGAFGGAWRRTGETFKVWTQGSATSPAACRFFSTSFAPRSSHFYTPFAVECALTRLNPKWQFEAVAFFLQLADASGNCASGTMPLYRLYNNGMGGAPNHRYTTRADTRNQMTAAGWIVEGDANTRVFACVPE